MHIRVRIRASSTIKLAGLLGGGSPSEGVLPAIQRRLAAKSVCISRGKEELAMPRPYEWKQIKVTIFAIAAVDIMVPAHWHCDS